MKRTFYLLKTLLVAVGLCVGANAWADPIETIGTTSSGWWTDFSETYTLEGYGKYHFQFTTTNANDGVVHKTWLLVATDGDYPKSYTGKGGSHTGTEYFVWRGDSYSWGQGGNSNDNPTIHACSNTYSTANPTGAGLQAAMNGAAVDMVITRESNNIYATATVTPSNGENEFTMSFSYLYGNATSANIGLFLTVQNAQVVLNTAEQTSKWSTVWTTDFSSVPSGVTYSINSGTMNIDNGYLLYYTPNQNQPRTTTLSFTDDAFNVNTDWVLEFDWNSGSSNTNGSNVVFATDQGTAFTMSWAQYATSVVVTNASSTELTNTLPCLGYNKGTCNSWSHITINGDAANGIYLTITNNGTTYVNKQLVTSTFGYPKTFNGTLGKNVSSMFVDNIVFRTPAVAGFVATPTSEVTRADGTNRKFTLNCLTDGATIYYATSDLEKGAAGWVEYTGEVSTDATTIYAYAKDNENNTSDKMNFETGAGTTIDLQPATVTHSNNGVYTIASNQSSILGAPTATIHYQIDGGSEQTSTSTSIVVNIVTDGTLTYWLTADGYGSVDPEDETVYAPRAYAVTTTIDFKTSNENTWSSHGDEVDVDGDTHTYYKYKDQSGKILGDGLLATTFLNGTIDNSWRIQRFYGGTAPYNNTEYVALKNLAAGQLIQIESSSAPAIVSNLTEVPASTYTGTYTYTATTAGDVIVSLGKGVVLKTIKLCETSVSKTITAAGWATYCSPYALDFSGVSGLTAYIITGATGSTLNLTQVNNVPANKGVLLEGAAGDYDIPVVASSSTDVSTNKLVGVTSETAGVDAGIYVLMNINSKVGFYQTLNAFTVGANTAYLPSNFAGSGSGDARAFYLFDDDATGINAVSTTKAETGNYYNLAGQRVAQPTKGLYIVNGKKVVIK